MPTVEADISPEWDRSIGWAALAERAVREAAVASGVPILDGAEVSVKFTSDEEVRQLNRQWRQKDKPTNVLSFPMAEPEDLARSPMLGDIVLAHGVCAREAEERGMPVEAHTAHLVVHGMLHLLGYDHETSDQDADEMEAVERRALAALGIADPYQVTEVQP